MKKAVMKRLLPLYVGKFFLSFVLWYSIEKLFIRSIGIDNFGISLIAIVLLISSILTEIPSGIIADRWSRKGSMVLAGLFLGISSLMAGASDNIFMYAAAVTIWGLHDAFSSGTGAAMIYDTLLEEQGHARNFNRALGLYETLGGIALIISNFLGGWIGEHSLLLAFNLTIVPIVISMVCHLIYKDAKISREVADEKLIKHTKNTFKCVFKSKSLLWLMTAIMIVFCIQKMNREAYQLWYIALSAPAIVFGIAGSFIEGLGGLGGSLVKYLSSRRINIVLSILLGLASLALSVGSNLWITIAAQVLIAVVSGALLFHFTAQIQHQLPSRYRTGSGSVINAVGRIVLMPLTFVFGVLSNQSVFIAGWMLVVLSGLAVFVQLKLDEQTSP
jgi:MFS transporter